MEAPIRILQVVTYMGRGGLETMLMNYYRHMDREKIQFDFLVHRDFEADYDWEILSLGGRIFHIGRNCGISSGSTLNTKSFMFIRTALVLWPCNVRKRAGYRCGSRIAIPAVL